MLKDFASNFSWNEKTFIYNMAEVLIILLVVFLANFTLKKLYSKFETNRKTESIYSIIIEAFKSPVKIFIWTLGLSYTIILINRLLHFDILHSVILVRKIIFISLIILFLLDIISQYEVYSKQQSKLKKRTHAPVGILCRVSKIVAVICGLLTIIETSGVNISGLLAFGSVSGLIVGFASKDLLANFFGATLLYLDKPFEVGDWIRSPDKNIEGTIESVSWRLTKIRTFDKRPLYVPNSVFNSIVIENASRMSHRRIKEIIGVRYSDIKAIQKIIKDIKMMLTNHEEIDSKQSIVVNLFQFNKSSVDFMIYAFTITTNWAQYLQIKQDILLRISSIIEYNNAKMAFPTTTIYLKDDETTEKATSKKI